MPFLTKEKANWKYILIVAFLSVIVGGGILVYLKYFEKEIISLTKFPEIKKPEKIETEKPKIEEEIANWKTYRNEEYGFEIKYPPDVIFSSQGPNLAQKKLNRGETISGTIMPSYDTIIFSDSHNEIAKIEIFHIYEKEISKENYWAELHYYGPCDARWEFKPEVFDFNFVNGIPMLKVKGKDYLDASQSCYYLKNLSGNLIVLSNYKEYKLDIFNQMLSTFRFLK